MRKQAQNPVPEMNEEDFLHPLVSSAFAFGIGPQVAQAVLPLLLKGR